MCKFINHSPSVTSRFLLLDLFIAGVNLALLSLQCLQEPFVRSLSSYHFHGGSSPFNRRITCLEWHPTHPTTLAVGSKGGDIYLWDFEAPAKKTFIQGVSSCLMVLICSFD